MRSGHDHHGGMQVASAHGVSRVQRPSLADRLFGSIFSRLLVYTILFEDNAHDLVFLSLGGRDRVFAIAGAGCGVASLVAWAPAAVDVVDSNGKHLAVTALKVVAARSVPSYDEFHQLLALGRHPRPESVIRRLTAQLPTDLRQFWRTGWTMFETNFYAHGLYARNLNIVRRFWPITPEYLRALNGKATDERAREVVDLLSTSMQSRVLAAMIRSPLSSLAAGINYTQRERNLRAVGSTDVVDGVIAYAARVARTDLEENWIAWYIATGGFNHEAPRALPLYLLPESHARSLRSPTEVRYWHMTLLQRLQARPGERWTHFCLSDVVDWLGADAQRALFAAVHAAAEPGARVVCRTVEDSSIVDALGMEDRFHLVEPDSTQASRAERSCLYRRVNFYEVIK